MFHRGDATFPFLRHSRVRQQLQLLPQQGRISGRRRSLKDVNMTDV